MSEILSAALTSDGFRPVHHNAICGSWVRRDFA